MPMSRLPPQVLAASSAQQCLHPWLLCVPLPLPSLALLPCYFFIYSSLPFRPALHPAVVSVQTNAPCRHLCGAACAVQLGHPLLPELILFHCNQFCA